MPMVIRRDLFRPVLLNSQSLAVSPEQNDVIQEILEVCSSDSAFAKKAYAAIHYALTQTPPIPPVVSSLNPASAVLGSPLFDIHVIGSGFVPGSIIVFNGIDEPTTLVSDTELTTGVNMDVWMAEADVPVAVRNPDGIQSDPLIFEFAAPVTLLSKEPGDKTKYKPVNSPPVFESRKDHK